MAEQEEYWTLDIEHPADAMFYGKLGTSEDHLFSLMIKENDHLILEIRDPASSKPLHKTTFYYNENSLGDRLILEDRQHGKADPKEIMPTFLSSSSSSSWSLNDMERQSFKLIGISKKNYYSSVNR